MFNSVVFSWDQLHFSMDHQKSRYSLEKSKVCFSYKPIELRIALIELQETIWLQIYWSSKTIMSMSSVMVLGETPALWGSLNYWFWSWCYSASCLYCSDEMEMWLNKCGEQICEGRVRTDYLKDKQIRRSSIQI